MDSVNEAEEGKDAAGQGIGAGLLELAVNNRRSDWPERQARAATRQLHTVGDHAHKLFEPDLSADVPVALRVGFSLNDSAPALLLTWYTILCSMWRPGHESHDIPRRDTTLQDLTSAG